MKNFNYLAGLCIAVPLFSFADPTAQDFSEMGFDELMQIEVTSVSKKSEKLSEAAAAVYVVTEDEIRRSGATNIPEALRLVPGVDVAQIDPNKWAVSIRGFNGRFANKLLVLIDGRSVYTPTYSGVYWEYFDYLMDDIARIEVIRGPGATLWGTNAVNGIINIITREAGENPGGSLSLAAGNEYQGASLRQGGEISDNAQLRAYAKGRRLDESENLAGEDQDNGGDYLQTGFRLDAQPNEEQWLTLQGDLYRDDLSQQHTFPTFESPYNYQVVNGDIEAKGGNLNLRWGLLTGLDSELSARFSYDFYDHQEVKYGDNRDTFDLEVQHQFSPLTNHDLVLGAGYRLSQNEFTSSIYASVLDATSNSKIWNLFIQDTIHFRPQNIALTLGAKFEGNNYSGTEFQPNLRASWVPSERLTWWAALSRAKRSPSRADTEALVNANMDISVYPTLIQVQGGEGFQSEQLDAYELGVRWSPLPKLSVDLATFYNDYSDLRSYILEDLDYSNYPQYLLQPLELDNNIEGRSLGGELLITWQATPRTRYRFVYNYLDIQLEDSESLSEELISLDEDRSLKHQLSLWGSFDLSKSLELDLRLYYTDQRSWGNQSIDSSVNGDLRLGWQATDSLVLSLVGRNLLHSASQEFITESWSLSSSSAIERSVFLKGTLSW
ncbi:TonB-dependent receptor plug domain-containing protein [Psychromonas sp.]|uniref:TonB-dependent receptor plug domain-containing protein n=1 Tax=Psychromonas sp. TaxID=1884585 RepID=UPI003561A178